MTAFWTKDLEEESLGVREFWGDDREKRVSGEDPTELCVKSWAYLSEMHA